MGVTFYNLHAYSELKYVCCVTFSEYAVVFGPSHLLL